MYDDVLFPVSFYLLDHTDLADHAIEIAGSLDARVHLLSLTLSEEDRRDIDDHRDAFDRFVVRMEEDGIEATSEMRDEPVGYEEVPDVIEDEADDHDMVVMGHTRTRAVEGGERTTAEEIINRLSIPVVVVPLSTPRFRDV